MNLPAVLVVVLVEVVAVVLFIGGWVRRSPGRLLGGAAVACLGCAMVLPRFATVFVAIAMVLAIGGGIAHFVMRRWERAS